ncbi:hypothetical protein [Pyruvatibacter mobilis]|uniref:hypothetical protein n=1 Tax=Pyruvatibacter mobilis TaxID=1712261 RepID=UPI003BAFE8D0
MTLKEAIALVNASGTHVVVPVATAVKHERLGQDFGQIWDEGVESLYADEQANPNERIRSPHIQRDSNETE